MKIDNRVKRRYRQQKEDGAKKINAMLYVKNPDELKDKMSKKEFQIAVIQKDGRCMNPQCPNHRVRDGRVTAHHIIFRSGGGRNIIEHGIALCGKCHDTAHGKCAEIGDEFMLLILVYWMNKAEWRWDDAFWWLVRRLSLKGRDYGLLHEDDGSRTLLVNGQPQVGKAD